MAEDIQTTVQFQADITDFKGAMQEANRSIKLANSEFKAASSGMDDWSSSTDGLTAKMKQLSTLQDAQKRKLDVLNVAYQQAVEEQGENSAAAQDLLVKINNQQAAVNMAEKELENYAERLREVQRVANGAGGALGGMGDGARTSGGDAKEGADGWSIFKGVIADLVANTISAAIDALANLAEATRDYRRDMAQLAQNAKSSGKDMDTIKTTLEGVAAVTGETDAAMEGLNMLMATGLDTDNLTSAAEAFAGAATKFDGLKFEGLAEGLQETLAVGSAVGPFAELIERTGGDLEKFNEGLAACTTEAERQQYTMQWLNESGLKGIHDSYVENNAALVEAEKQQFRYNDALASVGAAVEPINTKLNALKAQILEQLAPVIEDIVNWVLANLPTIEPIVIGIATALGVLAAALAIQGIINGVQKAFALLNTTMLANPIVLIVALLAGLVAAFVTLWNKSEAFREFWLNLWAGIQEAFAKVVEWFGEAAEKVGQFFVGAYEGIKSAWSAAGSFFSSVSSSVKNAFSSIGSWFRNIFSQAWTNVKNAWSGVTSFFSGIWSKIKSAFNFSEMLSIGKNIVTGIWDGVNSAKDWLWGKLSGWVDSIIGWAKKLLGIKSPSRVARDEIGKNFGLGVAEGVTDSIKAVRGAVRTMTDAAVDGLPDPSPRPGGAAAAGGRTIIFNQTNNSPRALSRREIYRQTHNALSYVGGA